MGKNLKITVAAILTLAIAGCAAEETPQATNPPVPVPKIAAKSLPKAQAFKNPVVPVKYTSQVASPTLNLIQPTNATERVVVISQGRNDPFAEIVGSAVAATPNTTGTKTVPKLPPLPTASIQTASATLRRLPIRSVALNQPNRVAKRPGLTPVLPRVLPQVVPNPTLVSVLPPTPQPDAARGVMVSGVVLIGREPQAIIKVPDEPTSRYVQAGQRLANGVLVKRIEMNEGSNPIVILEQYGIEVAKMVGEGAVDSKSSATTASDKSISLLTPL
ncbi:MAG: hypothetical protein KME21_05705 [Desmonostoc vinosum HA7617-LM4]|jgi:hypothetical protein|nr:hypothetical protein [Desmonostoc vinosum HA7617-LM4]